MGVSYFITQQVFFAVTKQETVIQPYLTEMWDMS